MLSENAPSLPDIEQHLDSLDATSRVEATRSLGRAQLRAFFDTAEGYRSMGLQHLVAADATPMTEVVHYGKNSLGAFSHFAKVFVRPESTATGSSELWGYNRTTSAMETFIGPGYFVAYPYSVDGEVLVDYLRVPPAKPDGWPEILPNSARLSFFVYNKTQDILRSVSEHVSIGRATKGGKNMNAWFILCREA